MSRRSPAEWLVAADTAARELPLRAISLLRARALLRWSALGFAVVLPVLLGSQPAMASPGCGDIPVISGICSTITGTVSFATDPTGYIAGQIKGAVGSLLGEFAHLINATTSVDFSNAGFLQTYAIGFAVASILTVILWLVAVAKRAVSGVGAVAAVSESIGLLMLSVTVTAFMPLATALVVGLVDDATNAALSPMLGNIRAIGNTVTSAWGPVASLSGGNVLMSILGILMLVAAAGVWLELVIRSALIYLTLALGVMVFSGLVDKSLWRHTKRWIGVMAGVILSKYVTLTTLALATALLANDNSSDVDTCLGIVLTALALFYLAMLAPVTLGRLIPVIGDDMAAAHGARAQAQGRIAGLPAQMSSASEIVAGAVKSPGGSPGGDWGGAGSSEQDAGTDVGISRAKAQATGTTPASGNSNQGSDARQSDADGATQGVSGEALPAESTGAGTDGTAQSGKAKSEGAEEAAAARGATTVAAAAEKAEQTGEQAVSAAVDRSSGAQIQQAPTAHGASSVAGAPGLAGSADAAEVPQQPPAPSLAPQTPPQEQELPPRQSQPPRPAPESAEPPSPPEGPAPPPAPPGHTPA